MITIPLPHALAWRLGRHRLDEASDDSVAATVRRIVALRGWPATTAEQIVTLRRAESNPGALDRALRDTDVVRVYAFRGGSYVMTPDTADAILAVRTVTRVWQTQRWQQQAAIVVDDWRPLRDAVWDMLADGPLTRTQIAVELGRSAALRHLADSARGAGADTLYKPLHWWGDLCFGPTRDGQTTFMRRPAARRGVPDVDAAGRQAVADYLAAYAPATAANLHYWLTEGLGAPRKRVITWLADLGDQVTEVETADEPAFVLTRDLDDMRRATPSDSIVRVPPYDPWVMGPGTADQRIVPGEHRAAASSGKALVIRGGVVTGTGDR